MKVLEKSVAHFVLFTSTPTIVLEGSPLDLPHA
jgi:hypothetical protein